MLHLRKLMSVWLLTHKKWPFDACLTIAHSDDNSCSQVGAAIQMIPLYVYKRCCCACTFPLPRIVKTGFLAVVIRSRITWSFSFTWFSWWVHNIFLPVLTHIAITLCAKTVCANSSAASELKGGDWFKIRYSGCQPPRQGITNQSEPNFNQGQTPQKPAQQYWHESANSNLTCKFF